MMNEQTRLANRKSLAEEVFEILRDRIIAGEYQLGAWLRQEEVARNLGVSQTPVREALDRLVAEGLAERVPYRGVRVARLTQEEIADIYAARLYLEAAVVQAAAHNISNQRSASPLVKDLQSLLVEIEGLKTLPQMARRRELNTQFHLKLAEICGNQVLARLYQMTLHQFPDWMIYEGMFRQAGQLQARLAREVREHRAILAAVSAGEAEHAAEKARQHVGNLRDELVQLLNVDAQLLHKKVRELGGQSTQVVNDQ
jgi:DNA-binding GntR family transcriptional regulator